MAEYHVRTNKDGTISAGTLKKEGGWNHSSIVTEEVLEAARDHLLTVSLKKNKDICYAWKYENGKTLFLKLEEKDSDQIKEEDKEE